MPGPGLLVKVGVPPMVMLMLILGLGFVLLVSSEGQTLDVGMRRVRWCKLGGRVMEVFGLSWARNRAEVGLQSILSVCSEAAVQRCKAYTVLESPCPESVSPLFPHSLSEVSGSVVKSG